MSIEKLDEVLENALVKSRIKLESLSIYKSTLDIEEEDCLRQKLLAANVEYDRISSSILIYRIHRDTFLSYLNSYSSEFHSLSNRNITGIGSMISALESYLGLKTDGLESVSPDSVHYASAIPNFKNRCCEHLREMKTEFEQTNWQILNSDERSASLDRLAKLAGVALQIPINGVFFYSAPSYDRGFYNGDGYLYLNSDTITSADNREEAINTIFHEGRHAFQKIACRNPELFGISPELAAAWRENYKPRNYISPRKNYFAYRLQPIELDAHEFADQIIQDVFHGGNQRGN